MKITKSELMEMIREALREELARTKQPLKEAIPTTTRAIINRYDNNVADHISELEHEKAFNDAEWFEDEWYALENVEVYPDHFVLMMDRPVESIQDAEAIISYAFSPANIVNIEEAMSEGGVVYDEDDNQIYVEHWVVNQLTESKHPVEDPWGYGPYKTFGDPTLKVGDYVLAPRSFSTNKQATYPAKITSISSQWIEYEISGFGFSEKGTKARPGSKTASTIKNAKKYLGL